IRHLGRQASGPLQHRAGRAQAKAFVQPLMRFGDDRMTMTAERKATLIKDYATKSGDTGSPEVQVALLTERINSLTDQFKAHKKDNRSRRGLLKMASQRRGLLDYLKSRDEPRYQALIKRLDIRR